MTYRFTIPLDYSGVRFVKEGTSDHKYLKVMLGRRYNGGFHMYEFIKIVITLYEHHPREPLDIPIMTHSSLVDLSKIVVKTLRGLAYDSLNQVVAVHCEKYNSEKQKIEIEVIPFEE